MLRSCNVKFRHNQAEHRLIILCANKYECYSGIPVMKKEDQETPCANFVYFFSYPFCKSNLPHQKRKICFLMLWFFFSHQIKSFSLVCLLIHVTFHKTCESPWINSLILVTIARRCCAAVRFSCRDAVRRRSCGCSFVPWLTVQPTRCKHLKIWEIWRWALQLLALFDHVLKGVGGGVWDVTLAAAVLLMCERRYSLRLRKDL